MGVSSVRVHGRNPPRLLVLTGAVRDFDEEVKVRLKRLAERHGRSMEEENRHILLNAAKDSGRPVTKLGSPIAARFSGLGLTTDLSELRGQATRPAEFKPRSFSIPMSCRRSCAGRRIHP